MFSSVTIFSDTVILQKKKSVQSSSLTNTWPILEDHRILCDINEFHIILICITVKYISKHVSRLPRVPQLWSGTQLESVLGRHRKMEAKYDICVDFSEYLDI